jgi:thioredoxin-like negative regulator of GroEL
VELSGEDCGACLSLMPVLHDLIAKRKDIRLEHVEVNMENKDLVEGWQVDRVPTVLLTDDGEIFARCHGFQPEEILELWIDGKMEEHTKSK